MCVSICGVNQICVCVSICGVQPSVSICCVSIVCDKTLGFKTSCFKTARFELPFFKTVCFRTCAFQENVLHLVLQNLAVVKCVWTPGKFCALSCHET